MEPKSTTPVSEKPEPRHPRRSELRVIASARRRLIGARSVKDGTEPQRPASGYCFPISRNGGHFCRDCCQHLKQQPVYLAISRGVWPDGGGSVLAERENIRDGPGDGAGERRLISLRRTQMHTPAQKRMNTKCTRTHRHMHTDLHSAAHTHITHL